MANFCRCLSFLLLSIILFLTHPRETEGQVGALRGMSRLMNITPMTIGRAMMRSSMGRSAGVNIAGAGATIAGAALVGGLSFVKGYKLGKNPNVPGYGYGTNTALLSNDLQTDIYRHPSPDFNVVPGASEQYHLLQKILHSIGKPSSLGSNFALPGYRYGTNKAVLPISPQTDIYTHPSPDFKIVPAAPRPFHLLQKIMHSIGKPSYEDFHRNQLNIQDLRAQVYAKPKVVLPVSPTSYRTTLDVDSSEVVQKLKDIYGLPNVTKVNGKTHVAIFELNSNEKSPENKQNKKPSMDEAVFIKKLVPYSIKFRKENSKL